MSVADGDAFVAVVVVVVAAVVALVAAVAGESSYQSLGLALVQRRDCGLGFACRRHKPMPASSCLQLAAACLAWVAAREYPTPAGGWESSLRRTCGIDGGSFAHRMGCCCTTLNSKMGLVAEGRALAELWGCHIQVAVLVVIQRASAPIVGDMLLAVRFAVRQARHVESSSCGDIAVRSKQQTRVGIDHASV